MQKRGGIVNAHMSCSCKSHHAKTTSFGELTWMKIHSFHVLDSNPAERSQTYWWNRSLRMNIDKKAYLVPSPMITKSTRPCTTTLRRLFSITLGMIVLSMDGIDVSSSPTYTGCQEGRHPKVDWNEVRSYEDYGGSRTYIIRAYRPWDLRSMDSLLDIFSSEIGYPTLSKRYVQYALRPKSNTRIHRGKYLPGHWRKSQGS